MKKVIVYSDKNIQAVATKNKHDKGYVIEVISKTLLVNLEVKDLDINGDYTQLPKKVQQQIIRFIEATDSFYFGNIVRIRDIKKGSLFHIFRRLNNGSIVESTLYKKDYYCQTSKSFCATPFTDMAGFRSFDGNTLVIFTD